VDIYHRAEAPGRIREELDSYRPGQKWFAYFRFYNPTEKYFDRSWPLPDFEQFSAGAISRAQQ